MARADKNSITEYLLGRLTESEEEQVELRLLTDPEFAEEYDIVVNEIVDDYVAGKFEGEELKQVEEYFFKSPERKNKLRFALALKEHPRRERSVSPPEPAVSQSREPVVARRSKWKFAQQLSIAASILIVVGTGFGVWRLYFYQSDLNKGLVALRTAFKDERPIEPRLADFNYAPLPNQRGEPPKIDYMQRDLAASLLLKEVNERSSAASHHALGQYYLANREFDKAIDQLNTASGLDPNNGKIHSDLGAALLEKGKAITDAGQAKRIQAFDESLTHLNKGVEFERIPLEALFNRALLYDYLSLPLKAEEDWQRYLQLDPNSKWAEEARQTLRLIEEKKKSISRSKEEIFQDFLRHYQSGEHEAAWNVVNSYHNRSGNLVVEQLLDEYLREAALGHNTEARARLQKLSYIGQFAKQRADEHSFFELAIFFGQSSGGQRATLARARTLMREGHEGWGKMKVEENLLLFSQAQRLFDDVGDVAESRSAQYWQSFCYYRQHENRKSLLILEPLISVLEQSGYNYLLARAFYLLAAVQFNRNEHSRALESAKRCLELAERIQDRVGIINALSSLTEYFRYLGYYDRSLSYFQRSFALVASFSMDPIQGSRHYGFGATAFASAGLLTTAAVFQNEALRFALSTKNASVISYNYAFLGTINGKLRNFEEGIKNTQTAYELAQGHTNEASDRELMAYAMLQRGHIQRQAESFDDAIKSYTNSIEGYRSLNHPTNLYQAHKGRFLSYVAVRNDGLAQEELATTLKLAEQYRDQILEETTRHTFFAVEQNLFDSAIDFQYSRLIDERQAFQLSESSRARSLLDLIYSDAEVLNKGAEPEVIPRSVLSPLSADEILRRVPPQTQLIQYSVLENKLFIWVISNGELKTATKDIGQKELSEKVLAYVKLASSPFESNHDALVTRGKELFDILIKPIESELDSTKQICVIPDKALNYLSFAALVSSRSGKYLFEDYQLIMAPSSTIFLACSRIAEEKKGAEVETLLSVGNPKFDRAAFSSFQDLPAAAEEAAEVAEYYESSPPLIGSDARVEVVRRKMHESDVIHLALHAALDEKFPLRSKLLLAAQPSSVAKSTDSVLYAYEIYGLKLRRTRLAVLSACETGAEHYYDGEGMISLARPFLAAKVPLVVASFWPVDSQAARELMVNFHRLRKFGGRPTVAALREAQLAFVYGADKRYKRPYYWAPFVVIGGYAEY